MLLITLTGEKVEAENSPLGVPKAQACGSEGLCEIRDIRCTNYIPQKLQNCNPQNPGTLESGDPAHCYQGCSSQITALEVHTAAVTRVGATGRQLVLAQGGGPSSWCSGRPQVLKNVGHTLSCNLKD